MSIFKKVPFFLGLIVVFFCLHGYVQAPNFLNSTDLLQAGLNVSIVFFFFFLLGYFFTRNLILTSFITFYFQIWYLFFGAIQDTLKPPSVFHFFSKYIFLVPFALVLSYFFIKVLKAKKQQWPKFVLYINVLFIIYLLVDFVQLFSLQNQKDISGSSVNFKYENVKQKPDVYLLVFDEYPSNYQLKKYFNYDNSNFSNGLKSKGFESLPISSNYEITFYSMASTFNMEYVKEKNDYQNHTQSDIGKRLKEIQNGQVFNIFKNLGFDIENNSIFDINNLPSTANNNRFLNGGGILLTDKIFINRVKKDLTVGFFEKFTSNNKLFQNLSTYKNRIDNDNMEEKLLSNLSIKNIKPIFSYTHLLMPHSPYFYDSIGNKIDFVKNKYEFNLNTEGFISYLKYTNKVIEKMVTSIKVKKPNAIIILLSDHGHRGLSDIKVADNDKLSNFAHIYVPNSNRDKYLRLDTITNVNLFRHIFNSEFNQDLLFLPDSSFYIKNKF